jgi:CheY-like chemotaxis protein
VAHLLIIDDDPAVGLTFRRMLEVIGHRVSRALSAEEGLAQLNSDPPDAILLDMRMPVMDGLEFLRRLRQDDRLRALPVGIVTGDYFLNEQVLAEIGELGGTIRYKPVAMEDLHALAAVLLDQTPSTPGAGSRS